MIINIYEKCRVYELFKDYKGYADGGSFGVETLQTHINTLKELCTESDDEYVSDDVYERDKRTKKDELIKQLEKIEEDGYIEVDEDGWACICGDYYVMTEARFKEYNDKFSGVLFMKK